MVEKDLYASGPEPSTKLDPQPSTLLPPDVMNRRDSDMRDALNVYNPCLNFLFSYEYIIIELEELNTVLWLLNGHTDTTCKRSIMFYISY